MLFCNSKTFGGVIHRFILKHSFVLGSYIHAPLFYKFKLYCLFVTDRRGPHSLKHRSCRNDSYLAGKLGLFMYLALDSP